MISQPLDRRLLINDVVSADLFLPDNTPISEQAHTYRWIAAGLNAANSGVFGGCISNPGREGEIRVLYGQTSMTRANRSISSSGKNWPVPAPGQPCLVVSQASRLSRLEFQNGQVRH